MDGQIRGIEPVFYLCFYDSNADDDGSVARRRNAKILQVFDMRNWEPEARAKFHFGDVFICEPDWSWSSGRLPTPDIWYVMEGVGWLRLVDAEEPARQIVAGDCVLMQRGDSYDAGHDPERPLHLIAVHFDVLDDAGQVLDFSIGSQNPEVLHMSGGSLVGELLIRAVRAYQDSNYGWTHAWLQPVLMEFIRQHQRTWPAGRFGDQARQIERICEDIRRHPGRIVRVEQLAVDLGISAAHFCRLFTQLQGVPPRKFITRTRIEAAQRLLLTSRHSIERIAGLLGYDSPFQFSRQFKAKTGISPSRFRSGNTAPRITH